MNGSKAFYAGVIGAVVMTVLTLLARFTGMTAMNLELTLGSMLTQRIDAFSWVLGFGMHLMAGGLFALIYAAGFEYLSFRGGMTTGLRYGLIHALFSGLLLGAMPYLHPLIPESIQGPGFFAINFGAVTVAAFVVLHGIYGATVGWLYGEPRKTVVFRGRKFREYQKAA